MIDTRLRAWCEHDGCTWKRTTGIHLARIIELAGYAHMKVHEGHAVSLNFTPRRPHAS